MLPSSSWKAPAASEIPAAKAIHRAGIAVIIANPRQTHQFAQSQSLTKTDAKDAKMLAFFAQMTAQKEGWQTMLYHPPTEAEEVLEALVSRRNQQAVAYIKPRACLRARTLPMNYKEFEIYA